MRMIRPLASLFLATMAVLAIQLHHSVAFTPAGSIAIPGVNSVSNDIFWDDATLGKSFLADRSNVGIDVFNTRTNVFAGLIPTKAGPNGVATDSAKGFVFFGLAADAAGNTALGCANAATLATISTITTGSGGSKTRSDELAVDPTDLLILIANDNDSPPFVTLVRYDAACNLTIVGKITLPGQTGLGIEQPVWTPEIHAFAVALPGANNTTGGIAIFGVAPFILQRTIPIDCTPAGLAHGPQTFLFVGCNPQPEVRDWNTGALIANLGTVASSDEVWYNPGDNVYVFGSRTPTPTTPTLWIYSAANNQLIEQDPLAGTFHNVTADAATNTVYVKYTSGNAVCGATACVGIFTPGPVTPGPSDKSGAGAAGPAPATNKSGAPAAGRAFITCPASAPSAKAFAPLGSPSAANVTC